MGRALGPTLATICLLAACLPAAGRADARTTPANLFVPVLIYHHVKLLKPSDNAIERGLTVLPRQFQDQLQYLKRQGYHTVTASALVQALRSGGHLPSRPVVLTFDDGYADTFPVAYRMLRDSHMTATFFVVPGFVGTSARYLTWSEIGAMQAHGMDIEAHSMTHPDLTTVPASRQRREIFESRLVLQRRLHRPVGLFAYPYGAYDTAILADVARSGYVGAFTTHQGWIASAERLLTLPRVYVDVDDNGPIFGGRLRADPSTLVEDPA